MAATKRAKTGSERETDRREDFCLFLLRPALGRAGAGFLPIDLCHHAPIRHAQNGLSDVAIRSD